MGSGCKEDTLEAGLETIRSLLLSEQDAIRTKGTWRAEPAHGRERGSAGRARDALWGRRWPLEPCTRCGAVRDRWKAALLTAVCPPSAGCAALWVLVQEEANHVYVNRSMFELLTWIMETANPRVCYVAAAVVWVLAHNSSTLARIPCVKLMPAMLKAAIATVRRRGPRVGSRWWHAVRWSRGIDGRSGTWLMGRNCARCAPLARRHSSCATALHAGELLKKYHPGAEEDGRRRRRRRTTHDLSTSGWRAWRRRTRTSWRYS